MIYLIMKRILDIFLSILTLIVLSPVFLLLAIMIKLDSKGPLLFKQVRFGKNKTLFNIIKFRTMSIEAPKDTPTHLLDNPELYITKVGKFLRKTSLDELPQVWNILIGQMSIVGPRPALWNQYDLIEQRDKYGVNKYKPGLTGWAQVNGRDELTIEVKSKLDGEYIEKLSFWMDVKCLLKTFVSVFKQEGILEGGTGKLPNKEVVSTKE
ncbi:MAG: capsular biosynthesis protein [Herbinix sp.]|nr:capsular biosynthesis protein [Herbinix sp.]